jgi:DNA polymerase III epsilon subunit-like protein
MDGSIFVREELHLISGRSVFAAHDNDLDADTIRRESHDLLKKAISDLGVTTSSAIALPRFAIAVVAVSRSDGIKAEFYARLTTRVLVDSQLSC